MSALDYKLRENIVTLTLNRPETLNSLTPEIGVELKGFVDKINRNSEIRVVVLTGAGRAFSSGGNLAMIEEKSRHGQAQNEAEMVEFYGSFLSIRNIEVPVIAAINGPAIGAGFCLALACDLRYASNLAKVGANFVQIGLAPGMGATYLLDELVGFSHAREILYTGQIYSAKEALALGLINKVVPQAALESRVRELALAIANAAPLAVRAVKKLLGEVRFKSLAEALASEAAQQTQTFYTQDLVEGIRAIKGKRKPHFRGA